MLRYCRFNSHYIVLSLIMSRQIIRCSKRLKALKVKKSECSEQGEPELQIQALPYSMLTLGSCRDTAHP